MWPRPAPIRTRLTLWYVGVLAGILAVYLASVTVILFWQMSSVLKRIGAEDLETVKGLLYVAPDGSVEVREDFHHHSDWKQVQERLLEVLSPDGKILYRNERLGDRTIGGRPFDGEGQQSYSGRSDKASDGTPIILISRTWDLQGHPVLIRVGYRQDLIWNELRETVLILLLTLPIVLAGTAYAGYKMVGRTLDPVTKMTSRAEQINSERLSERVPEDNPDDELGHLARVFNAMLSRIEQSFEQLRRFTADASHELRTPLAAMRSTGEVGLQRSRTPEEYRDVVGSMLEEVNRLTNITENLLILSRADAGQITVDPVSLRASELIHEAASLLEVLIEDKHLHFHFEGDEEATVCADRLYLRQAIVNILHNAVKFTPERGSIIARVSREGDSTVELSIRDTGPGIDEHQASRIFERFYRGAGARSEENGGAGLGLSIALWAVRANNGEMGTCAAPGGGATFWIRLPKGSSLADEQGWPRTREAVSTAGGDAVAALTENSESLQ